MRSLEILTVENHHLYSPPCLVTVRLASRPSSTFWRWSVWTEGLDRFYKIGYGLTERTAKRLRSFDTGEVVRLLTESGPIILALQRFIFCPFHLY